MSDNTMKIKDKMRWQVLCGDKDHWRVGIYSPEFQKGTEIDVFEKHDCPEFFMLIEGEVSLAVIDGAKLSVIELKPMEPVMVNEWHNGFCPRGANTGKAIVVERDIFNTQYKKKYELLK